MAEAAFSKPVEEVVATLTDMYRHQGQTDIVELLETASARIDQIDYDNWNGGTYSYALMLDVPVSVFTSLEPRLAEIEKSISTKLTSICRNLINEHLDSVAIAPSTSKLTSVGQRAKPADAEVSHIWKAGFFRLFLSHVSAHKVAISKLKSELHLLGISGFVAHEDIKPSLEWQNEIELALRSMHALAALLTSDFHPSNWTDQEVGFALGKGVLVVPVRLGLDPYGFIGKVQGLSGSLDDPFWTASLLKSTLLNHSSTRRQMRNGLVRSFEAAESFVHAIALSKEISAVKDYSESEKETILRACKTNGQVFNATGVVSRVCLAIEKPEPKRIPERDNEPF